MKILIIDDEVRSVNLLCIKLEANFPKQFEISTAFSCEEAKSKIESFRPELVFLDIQIPVVNGFELLASLPRINFKVVFVTAFEHYAIKAIRYSALDYLLKPILDEELIAAVKRYMRYKEDVENNYSRQIQNFLEKNNRRLTISESNGILFLETDKIIRCEAELNYTKFFLAGNKKVISSKTLKEYEELLDEEEFIRVHRSHLVNIHYVVKYQNDRGLLLKDDTIVPVSRRRKDFIIQVLMSYKKLPMLKMLEGKLQNKQQHSDKEYKL